MTKEEAAREIVTNLGDRSIYFPLADPEVMNEIYKEIADTITRVKS